MTDNNLQHPQSEQNPAVREPRTNAERIDRNEAKRRAFKAYIDRAYAEYVQQRIRELQRDMRP